LGARKLKEPKQDSQKNKNVDIKLVRMTSIWNNIHQVRSKSKGWEAK